MKDNQDTETSTDEVQSTRETGTGFCERRDFPCRYHSISAPYEF
jgi:hypothetical protein